MDLTAEVFGEFSSSSFSIQMCLARPQLWSYLLFYLVYTVLIFFLRTVLVSGEDWFVLRADIVSIYVPRVVVHLNINYNIN